MTLQPPIPVLRIFDVALAKGFYDCSPWTKVFMRPGVDVAPWNAKVMEVIDPFGNRLCFNQPLAASGS
jgi:hypothetical protein